MGAGLARHTSGCLGGLPCPIGVQLACHASGCRPDCHAPLSHTWGFSTWFPPRIPVPRCTSQGVAADAPLDVPRCGGSRVWAGGAAVPQDCHHHQQRWQHGGFVLLRYAFLGRLLEQGCRSTPCRSCWQHETLCWGCMLLCLADSYMHGVLKFLLHRHCHRLCT